MRRYDLLLRHCSRCRSCVRGPSISFNRRCPYKTYAVQFSWQGHDFPFAHRGILTFPMLRLLQSFNYLRCKSSVLRLIWVLAAVGGAIVPWMPRRSREFPTPERIFGSVYTSFLLCYNLDVYSRFILPSLPLLLFAMRKWILKVPRLPSNPRQTGRFRLGYVKH